ncbi:MAG: hypothetical protein ACREMI_11185 [Gemmatimonadales bacterium]
MFATALLLLQATFQSPRLIESSGVAISRADPDVLWSHNDSGDGPYLYATDRRGTDRGRLHVSGAFAIDWEDMASGPCPVRALREPRCLYLADTGDNLEVRPFVTVYVIPEPEPPENAGDTLGTTRAAAVLNLSYPDGSHDVEGIYVSPRDTALYLVSKGYKRGTAIRVYRVDLRSWTPRDTATNPAGATLVQTLDITPNREAGRVITGATVRRDGRLVALRTYNEIYLFYPGVGGRLTPAREQSCSIAAIDTGGEAIAFDSNTTFVLTSEASRTRKGTINTVRCQ